MGRPSGGLRLHGARLLVSRVSAGAVVASALVGDLVNRTYPHADAIRGRAGQRVLLEGPPEAESMDATAGRRGDPDGLRRRLPLGRPPADGNAGREAEAAEGRITVNPRAPRGRMEVVPLLGPEADADLLALEQSLRRLVALGVSVQTFEAIFAPNATSSPASKLTPTVETAMLRLRGALRIVKPQDRRKNPWQKKR